MLGWGFRESSIVAALRDGARMIGCDSGTTDFGPHMSRAQSSGSPADSDVFGVQQYAPLLDLEVSLAGGRA